MIQRDTIYTNVALRPDGTPWWEGHDDPPPARGARLAGPPVDAGVDGEGGASQQPLHHAGDATARRSHPSSTTRTACRSTRCIFGARRQRRVPLVYEARNWQHGTFLGATLSSETTAAATGKVGVLRRDPMAMLPFCGYNMGDYFQHWLDVGASLAKPPRVFRVNWFRTGDDGKFLWPGFGDNMRVLQWVLERCDGSGAAIETPIGYLPTMDAIDKRGPVASATTSWRGCCGSIRPSGSRRWPGRRTTSASPGRTCRRRCTPSTTTWRSASTTRWCSTRTTRR